MLYLCIGNTEELTKKSFFGFGGFFRFFVVNFSEIDSSHD